MQQSLCEAVLVCQLTNWNEIRSASRSDGDAVLIETARRLVTTSQHVDTVARSDVDEFVVLALVSSDQGRQLATHLREAVARALSSTSPLTPNGASLGPNVARPAAELLQVARQQLS
jgi:GGDEF domain-containing protein